MAEKCTRNSGATRRKLLRLAGFGLIGSVAPCVVNAGTRAPGERALAFYNTHTGESLRTVYWAHGQYVPEALSEISFVLRDHRNNETRAIAPALLDLVHELARMLEGGSSIHVISGYRSPASNAMLAARNGGVARHSLHVVGEAIDVRIPGRDLKDLQRAALALRRGGVGYYPRSDFVHVDIGRVRAW